MNPFSPSAPRTIQSPTLLPFFVCLPLLLVLGFFLYTPQPVKGFALDANLNNGTPFDRSDDLLDAARWSDVPGSYVDHGVRGLGAGLEYSVSSSFCADLIPRFVDSPSCEEIRLTVQQTFDIWAQDNPKIGFVDVSSRVDAMLPPSWVGQPWQGFGAEIDILAASPDQFDVVKDAGAWTGFWYSFADPMGTNERILPGNSLTSADIVFNSRASFYLDPAQAVNGSIDFARLLLHEIGHTFGIGHPTQEDIVNFDNDNDPFNVMSINCESPYKGIVPSPMTDQQSVMNPDLTDHRERGLGLSEDELGALRFLYPVC